MKLCRVCLLCFFFFGISLGETLYGVVYGYKIESGSLQVSKISSGHGIREPIAIFPELSLATGNKCTFDQVNGVIYMVARNLTTNVKQLYGVSLHSGDLLSVSPIPDGRTAAQLSFNPNNGQVVYTGLSSAPDDSSWAQYSINPTTGTNTLLNSYNTNSSWGHFLGFGPGFDPVNSIQWIPSVFTPVANESLSFPKMCGLGLDGQTYILEDPNNSNPPTYSYLPDGTMYTIGDLRAGRNTVQFSLTDSSTESIAMLTDNWLLEDGGFTAYSNATNTLYSALSHADDFDHTYLVGFDVQTGQTKSASLLEFGDYLLCLGYIFA